MDQVQYYFSIALYIAFFVCFAILMGHFLWHKQWLFTFLSLVFAFACYGGFLIALVIGWQEAGNWQIKKLMRWYTGLLVIFFFMSSHALYKQFTTAPPPPDQRTLMKQQNAARQFNR